MTPFAKFAVALLTVLSLVACKSEPIPGTSEPSSSAATDEAGNGNSDNNEANNDDTDTENKGRAVPIEPVRHDGLKRADIHGRIISEDGTEIAMTVFLPDLAPNQAAPVIFHSHGWGGSRLTALSPSSGEGDFIANAPAEAAFLARENGAIVVSYDQRGFGESGGKSKLMSPEKEGRDFVALLDHIDNEYRTFIKRSAADGKPRVGTLGLSYGGGYQWVAGSIDERVDAMVPLGTWYDLRYSLHSGDTPKSTWLAVLMGIGVSGSNGNLHESLYENFGRALAPGVEVDEDFLETLSRHGLRAYCEGYHQGDGDIPQAATLIIQGVEDTLFNMNEAADAFECLRDNGRETSLIIQRTAHVLPFVERSPGPEGFGTERFLQCGDQRFETSRLMFEFLDTRLRGTPDALPVPEVCMTLNQREGITGSTIPRGGELFTLGDHQLKRGNKNAATLLEPANLADLSNLPADYLERLSPSLSVELLSAEGEMALAGIPLVELVVDTLAPRPTLYLGLKVEPASGEGAILIHNQVAPISGTGRMALELPGVTYPLEEGDRLFLVVYSAHPLYIYNDRSVQSTGAPITLRNIMIELPL